MKSLFPKKQKHKDQLITKVKKRIYQLSLKRDKFSEKANIAFQNTMIALRKEEKDKAKNFMIQNKQLQKKADITQNKISNYERYIDAIEEGIAIEIDGELLSEIEQMLINITSKTSPLDVTETRERVDELVNDIEDSQDFFAGDPELDFGIDVTEDLNKLETKILLDTSGPMPNIPLPDDYISDLDSYSKDINLMSKEELKKEIEKYKKELEL
ncbi:MAG: hypothetical protein ACFFAN_01855 [Promethearchaeota archaeon]